MIVTFVDIVFWQRILLNKPIVDYICATSVIYQTFLRTGRFFHSSTVRFFQSVLYVRNGKVAAVSTPHKGVKSGPSQPKNFACVTNLYHRWTFRPYFGQQEWLLNNSAEERRKRKCRSLFTFHSTVEREKKVKLITVVYSGECKKRSERNSRKRKRKRKECIERNVSGQTETEIEIESI